jgi:ketopantoate reductase
MNYHSIFELPGTREAFLDLALEASSIATAEGFNLVDLPGPLKVGHLVSLPRVDALRYLASLADNMIAAGQTSIKVSMLQSIERKRPIEVAAIFSDTLELANHHNLEVPKMRFVTQLLESIDTHIKENLQ